MQIASPATPQRSTSSIYMQLCPYQYHESRHNQLIPRTFPVPSRYKTKAKSSWEEPASPSAFIGHPSFQSVTSYEDRGSIREGRVLRGYVFSEGILHVEGYANLSAIQLCYGTLKHDLNLLEFNLPESTLNSWDSARKKVLAGCKLCCSSWHCKSKERTPKPLTPKSLIPKPTHRP